MIYRINTHHIVKYRINNHHIHLLFVLVWKAPPCLLFPFDVDTGFMRWAEIICTFKKKQIPRDQRLTDLTGVEWIALHYKERALNLSLVLLKLRDKTTGLHTPKTGGRTKGE